MAVFTEEEQLLIRRAVESAEKNTSGEIRVCIEKNCDEEVLDRAAKYFYKLDMDKTRARNGVLIYLATVDRKFAIIGDAGIHQLVTDSFWDSTKHAMLEEFKYGNLVAGIVKGVTMAGQKLKKHFPHMVDNQNELPDDIAFMDADQ